MPPTFTQSELRQLLQRLIAGWENEVVEFKKISNSYATSTIGKYFSALTNEANLRTAEEAWLVFGVHNETRKVVGSDYRTDRERLDGLKHQLVVGTSTGTTVREIHEVEVDGLRVVMLEIPPAPRGVPVAWEGHYHARAGESLIALSEDKREAIRGQSAGLDWSAATVADARVSDLDTNAVLAARTAFAQKNKRFSAAEVGGWSDLVFLQRCRLANPAGRLNRAALLLLGGPSAPLLLTPQPAQLTWKLVGQEEAYEHFEPPFLLATSELYKRIRNVELAILPQDSLMPVKLSKYDQRIVLEALHNCIAHQDYRRSERVLVTETPDRVVFDSAGCFFEGRPEDYATGEKTPTRYRNTVLTHAMVALNMIDTMGRGIGGMVRRQAERHMPLPDYNLDGVERVRLTLHGQVIDPAYSRLLIARTDLSLRDVVALDRVQKRLDIDATTAKRLKRASLVEGRRPALRVSARIAEVTEQKARLILSRPQDSAFLAKLVLDHVRQYGAITRENATALIGDKLGGDLSERQIDLRIRRLFTQMRSAGQLKAERPGPGAPWVLGPSPDNFTGMD